MPSAAPRPKNPCRASLIEGCSVGVPNRPHPTSPDWREQGSINPPGEQRRAALDPPRLAGEAGREQADGTPALRPESTCHMHYFRRACGRWSKRHCGVPANPRTLGESDTSNGGMVSGPRGPLMIQGPPPPYAPPQVGQEGRRGACIGWIIVPPDRDIMARASGNVEAGFT
jgi:hypothetical protein